MKRTAQTVEGRHRLTPGFGRLTSTVVLAAFTFFTALPIAAAVDRLGGQPTDPTPSAKATQWSEDRDTISTLPPEPDPREEPASEEAIGGIPKLVFPLASSGTYTASFGAPRSGGRTHKGIDIFADKLTPVLATADGTVILVRDTVGGTVASFACVTRTAPRRSTCTSTTTRPEPTTGLGMGSPRGSRSAQESKPAR